MNPGGGVRSVQAADVQLPREQLDAMWSATYLERLARTYWWYLSRISLATDMVFSDGSALELATMSGSVGAGLVASLTVAV